MGRTGERQEKVEEIANGPIDSCLKGIDDDEIDPKLIEFFIA